MPKRIFGEVHHLVVPGMAWPEYWAARPLFSRMPKSFMAPYIPVDVSTGQALVKGSGPKFAFNYIPAWPG